MHHFDYNHNFSIVVVYVLVISKYHHPITERHGGRSLHVTHYSPNIHCYYGTVPSRRLGISLGVSLFQKRLAIKQLKNDNSVAVINYKGYDIFRLK